MRILIAALLGLLINIAYWVQFRGFDILRDFVALRDYDITKDIVLLVLGGYLVVEALLLIRRTQAVTEEALEKEEQESEFLAHEIDEMNEVHQKVEALQVELHRALEQKLAAEQLANRAEEERGRLVVALKEANTKAEQMASEAAPPTDQLVNAEIVSFLGLLQQKGRFVDFVMDDITPYSDTQVGAAARVVHQGCRAVMERYFSISPVHEGQEGEKIELPKGSNLDRYRLVGRVVGEPPFKGTVVHRGWKTVEVSLPRAVADRALEQQEIIAPAEIEVSEPRSAH